MINTKQKFLGKKIYIEGDSSCLVDMARNRLFADNLDELHRLAKRIGLRRRWFQRKSAMPHYDLTRNKRREAIMAGALIVDKATESKYISLLRSRN